MISRAGSRQFVVLATLAVVVETAAAACATTPGRNGQIAFRRYADPPHTSGVLFAMDADGGQVTQIMHPPAHTLDDQPEWSRDGKRLTSSPAPRTAPASSTWEPTEHTHALSSRPRSGTARSIGAGTPGR